MPTPDQMEVRPRSVEVLPCPVDQDSSEWIRLKISLARDLAAIRGVHIEDENIYNDPLVEKIVSDLPMYLEQSKERRAEGKSTVFEQYTQYLDQQKELPETDRVPWFGDWLSKQAG